jgi:hypothetical protein
MSAPAHIDPLLLDMDAVAKRLGRSRRTFKPPTPRKLSAEDMADADRLLIPDWARHLLVTARKRAAKLGMPCTITAADMATLVKRCRGRCEVSGIPFDHDAKGTSFRRPFAPSLDRKRSDRGCTPGNVRLVCVAVNTAMSDWGEGVLLLVARALVEKHEGR